MHQLIFADSEQSCKVLPPPSYICSCKAEPFSYPLVSIAEKMSEISTSGWANYCIRAIINIKSSILSLCHFSILSLYHFSILTAPFLYVLSLSSVPKDYFLRVDLRFVGRLRWSLRHLSMCLCFRIVGN